jgi:DNA invertase Pin-like site-specific DNA recombinase
MSRFSRNTLQGLQFIEKLNQMNCDLYNSRDKINYNNIINRNMFRIRLSEAQNESEVMSMRQKNSINIRKRMGYKFGRVPYGYRAERINGVRKFVLEPNEKKIIGTIIELKNKNHSNVTIANKLNSTNKFKRGKLWTPIMITTVINSYNNNSNMIKAIKEIESNIISESIRNRLRSKTNKLIDTDFNIKTKRVRKMIM